MKRFVFGFCLSLLFLSFSFPAISNNANNADEERRIQEQIRQAQQQGQNDGSPDGHREAQVRGPESGRINGDREGYRAGFNTCEADEKRRAYDTGYRRGIDRGRMPGDRDGRDRGHQEGRINGEREGFNNGVNRARSDAKRDAYPRGRERGFEEAENSDALARGERDGIAKGDSDAAAEALRVDYPRGRKDYSDQRWAENVEREDSIRLNTAPSSGDLLVDELAATILPMNYSTMSSRASPDYRFNNPRRSYSNPQVQQAYNNAYRQAYQQGFSSAYSGLYNSAYRSAYDAARPRGCNEARGRSYSSDERRGYDAGYREAYDRAYRFAYDTAYRNSYDTAFRDSTERAYARHYDGFYEEFFEEARVAAYRARYNELYESTYRPAYRASYDQKYPIYAAQQYRRGVADETEDFSLRPVRLLEGARATETIVNGIFEPGETLRIFFKLRNFASQSLRGSDVKITLSATDHNGAVVSQAETLLPGQIAAKSILNVSEALAFRMSEGDINRVSHFNFNVYYKGRSVGSTIIRVHTQFLFNVEFAQDPKLQEGLMSPLYLKVTNRGNVSVSTGATLNLKSNPELLEIEQETIVLETLNAGETRIVEFRALVRSGRANLDLPFAIEAGTAEGRRIGLNDYTRSVPVLNDYRISVLDARVSNLLKGEGLVRVPYRIKNVSSRLTFKGLQLKVRFLGDASASHMVLGPNPQYLVPLQQGQHTDFVIPVMSQKSGMSGTLELEVQEDGNTVVIHQLKF